ncbi:uncharacterized protein LOC111115651 isoform X2 [Crassostrea virginica]
MRRYRCLTPCEDSTVIGKWHVFPDSSKACFWLNSMAMNLSDHQALCRTHDGYLAYISDTEMFSTVFNLLYNYGDSFAEYYLGCKEDAGMLFTLFGQPVTYANWASTQPSSVSETCVTIYGSSGIYYDTDCGSRHYGVCSSIPNFSGFHETGVLDQNTSPSSHSMNQNCSCLCHATYNLNPNVSLTAEEEAEIVEMKKNLTVEKSTLSSEVRKRVCATDDRQSSQTIGVFGVCFLASTFGIFVFVDCVSVFHLFQNKN